MKYILVILLMVSLTGCELFPVRQETHTTTMTETLKDICGSGFIEVESSYRELKDDSKSSQVKFKCNMKEGMIL